MRETSALLIVDLQNDFCPGGALQVPGGDHVIEPINRAIALFTSAGLPVLASRDWHPQISSHFRDFGGVWPVHCVQGTHGADFTAGLHLPDSTVVISKGMAAELAGYSAFEGVNGGGRPLADLLDELEVRRLYVCGLATDYCVLRSVLDALRRGFDVTLLVDAVAGVEVVPGASDSAIAEMKKAGAQLASVDVLQCTLQPELPGPPPAEAALDHQ